VNTSFASPPRKLVPYSILLMSGQTANIRNHEIAAAALEAVVSSARAALGVGLQVVVPADASLALLVATVGQPYAEPPSAEPPAERKRAPVEVRESVEESPVLRSLLAPLALSDAIGYFDPHGSQVDLRKYELTDLDELSVLKPQPVTLELLEQVKLLGLIVVAPDKSLEDHLPRILERMEGRVLVLTVTADPVSSVPYHGLELDYGLNQQDDDHRQSFYPQPWPSLLQEQIRKWIESA
jgi:hypothetical protein